MPAETASQALSILRDGSQSQPFVWVLGWIWMLQRRDGRALPPYPACFLRW